MATITDRKDEAMNATITRNVSMKGGRKFVKGERVEVIDESFLFLSWLNETQHSLTVVEGDHRYSVPFNKVQVDEGVELEQRHQRA